MQSTDPVNSHATVSFSTYSSSDSLAKVAARVVQEFHSDLDHYLSDDDDNVQNNNNELDDDDGDDFEFPSVCIQPLDNSSPIPADEIFYNGQIRPVYPLFNTDLLFADQDNVEVRNSVSSTATDSTSSSVRIPLRKLFIEERERGSASCSSSEADELDGVPEGTYCVWRPKAVKESPDRCKKSNSTGTSKRWKFRDLLYRSNSEGKDSFVFLAPSHKKKAPKGNNKGTKEATSNGVGGAGEGATTATAPVSRNGIVKESDRRRGHIPYKKDMVGMFANVSGVSRNLHPF